MLHACGRFVTKMRTANFERSSTTRLPSEATLFPRPGVECLGQTDRLVKFIASCLLFVGRDRNLFWSIDENNFHWARLDKRQTEIDPNTTETGLNVGLAGFRE